MSEQDQHQFSNDPGDAADRSVDNSVQENSVVSPCGAENIVMQDKNYQEKCQIDKTALPNSGTLDENDSTENESTLRMEGKEVFVENHGAHKVRNRTVRQVCWYFTKQGYCRFGQNCRYLHPKRAYNLNSAKERFSSRNTYSETQPYKRNGNMKVTHDAKSETSDVGFSLSKDKAKFPKAVPRSTNNIRGPCDDRSHIDSTPSSKNRHHSYLNSKPLGLQSNLNSLGSHQRSLVYYNSERRPQKLQDTTKKANCYFFKQGFCRKGDQCKFSHDLDFQKPSVANLPPSDEKHSSNTVNEISEQCKISERKFAKPYANKVIPTTRQALQLNDLSDTKLNDLRETEIRQLKKRFIDYVVVASNTEDVFQVTFVPSDPDWSFDVKSVVLEVVFRKEYPCEACHIEVVNEHVDLPPLLVKFLNKSIVEWLKERYHDSETEGQVELVFKPFLRWFDRNLEDLFIIGLRKVKQHIEAKEAGIEFVPFEDLQSTSGGKDSAEVEDSANNEYSGCEADGESEGSVAFENSEKENVAPSSKESDSSSKDMSSTDSKEETLSTSSTRENRPFVSKLGTEIKLLDFELTESAAALTCQKVVITLQCNRCKTRDEVISAAKKCNTLNCTKCHQVMQVTFHAALLHQFSAAMGNLHLVNCQIVDIPLMNCVFLVDCLNCMKQISISGIHYGQQRLTWCMFCNKKLSIYTSSVKFHHLQPASLSGTANQHLNVEKKNRKVRDPAIQDGKPLPDCGVCKHYKKSYRWLRFPCCGKAYSCDVCHDEKETDHEMKYANRMICGFCAHEQPYSSDKPCVRCSSSMTKRFGPHWEGGRGCRDKIKMSRDDHQKYSGINKTISRRAQSLKPNKGK